MTPIIQNYMDWRTLNTEAIANQCEETAGKSFKYWGAVVEIRAKTSEDLAAKIILALEGDDDLETGSMKAWLQRDALALLTNEKTFRKTLCMAGKSGIRSTARHASTNPPVVPYTR